jgi:hypothetical protein
MQAIAITASAAEAVDAEVTKHLEALRREVCARANCTFWFGETPTPVTQVSR